MKQLPRSPTTPLVFVTAFLLFGAPAVSHLPSMGEAQAYPGCGSGVSIACTSFCMAYERCITGGGAALCTEERNALLTCINIPEVRVVGVRVATRVPVMLFRTSYPDFRLLWSEVWNSWVAQRTAPPPPPKDETLVGRCFRPVGVAPGLPTWIVNFAVPHMPNHHDVRTRRIDAGTTTETTRGSFAVEMARAIFAAWDWVLDPEENDGFVEGVVRDSAATAGRCNLSKVETSTYDRVFGKIVAPEPREYHLVLYNCQHWAAEQVR